MRARVNPVVAGRRWFRRIRVLARPGATGGQEIKRAGATNKNVSWTLGLLMISCGSATRGLRRDSTRFTRSESRGQCCRCARGVNPVVAACSTLVTYEGSRDLEQQEATR